PCPQKEIAPDDDDVALHSAREVRRLAEHKEIRRHDAVARQHEPTSAGPQCMRTGCSAPHDGCDAFGTRLAPPPLPRAKYRRREEGGEQAPPHRATRPRKLRSSCLPSGVRTDSG